MLRAPRVGIHDSSLGASLGRIKISAEGFISRGLDVEPRNVLSGARGYMFGEGVCFIYSGPARA